MEKRCTVCKEVKSLDCFYKQPRGFHGVRADCKDCSNRKNVERYRANPPPPKHRDGSEACKRCGVLSKDKPFAPHRLLCEDCFPIVRLEYSRKAPTYGPRTPEQEARRASLDRRGLKLVNPQVEEKRCTTCGETKEIAGFPLATSAGRYPGRRHWRCYECHREAKRKAMAKPDAREQKNRRARDKFAALPAEEKEVIRAKGRAVSAERAKNPELVLRRRDLANAGTERNKPKVLARNAKWRRNNRLKMREYYHRYQARKRNATIGEVSYDRILERDGMHCYLCDSDIMEGELSFDHVVPLSREGAHSEDNIRAAHMSCNSRKRDRLLHEIRGTWLKLVV